MADLADGESCEVQGSAAKPYTVKNTGGVYSCSCPAWRNQSIGIESRTCKHIRRLRGDAAEKERVGSELPAKAKGSGAKKDAPPLLLAHAWDNATDLSDWWISEKLDGVRAYWTGKYFLSRLGNRYHAPDWFTDGLPDVPLDGELWIDRGMFQRTVSVVRRQDKSDHWKEVRYVIFDAPGIASPFEERLTYLTETIQPAKFEFASLLEHERCKGDTHLRKKLAAIESLGGEGLMLREPASQYEIGRSSTLLKVKTFHDAEATVIDHSAGRGKHKGRLGALVVQLDDGTEFNIGTGFSDAERESPPGVGSTVTFRYQELTNAGVPRFPSFVRLRSGTKSPTKKKAKTTTKAKTTPSTSGNKKTTSAADVRYYEFDDGTSAKFWEISQLGSSVAVRYGRIGSAGQAKSKEFDSEEAALRHSEKLIQQKADKGYRPSEEGS